MKNIIPWIIATAFFAYQYALRALPNMVLDETMHIFSLSASEIGQVTGLYYISYTLMHIPIGVMLDKFGARKMLAFASMTSVIAMLPLVYTSSVILLIIGKLLLGFVSSVGIIGVMQVIRDSFDEKKFLSMLSISVTTALLTAMYSGIPLKYCLEYLGWYGTFTPMLVLGILISVAAYIFVPDLKQDSSRTRKPILANLKELFSMRGWLIISVLGGMMIGPMEGFADQWGTKFLSVVHNQLSANQAAFLPSVIMLGLALGSPVTGLLCSRFNAYYAGLTLCSATMFLGMYAITYMHCNFLELLVILLIVGVACSYQNIVLYITGRIVTRNCASTASACANMIMMGFGYLFHSSIGSVIGNNVDNVSNLIAGISVITYALAAATIALPVARLFIREKI